MMNPTIQSISKNFFRQFLEAKEFIIRNPKTKIGLIVFSVLSLVYITSKVSETKKVVYRDNQNPAFTEGRILGSQASSYLKNKEVQLGKTARKLMAENKALVERMSELEKRMEAKS